MLQLSSDKLHVKVEGQFQAAKNGRSVKLNGPEAEFWAVFQASIESACAFFKVVHFQGRPF